MCVREKECNSVLEKLREESRENKGIRYSGVWVGNVCVRARKRKCECVRGVE